MLHHGSSSYNVFDNRSVSGFEEHSVIESCFSVVSNHSLGGNLNWSKGFRIALEVIHSLMVEFVG